MKVLKNKSYQGKKAWLRKAATVILMMMLCSFFAYPVTTTAQETTEAGQEQRAIFIAAIGVCLVVLFYSSRMKKKNIELERAKMAQSSFLSRMSHDMRTPMNVILGLSYLMEKEQNMDTTN